jgi:hypothetical protein
VAVTDLHHGDTEGTEKRDGGREEAEQAVGNRQSAVSCQREQEGSHAKSPRREGIAWVGGIVVAFAIFAALRENRGIGVRSTPYRACWRKGWGTLLP